MLTAVWGETALESAPVERQSWVLSDPWSSILGHKSILGILVSIVSFFKNACELFQGRTLPTFLLRKSLQ